MSNHYTSAVILNDILYVGRKGRMPLPTMREQHAMALGKLLCLPLLYGTGLESKVMTWNDGEEFRRQCYAACLGSEAPITHNSWLRLYEAAPPQTLVELCRHYFCDKLVIGYSLPPVLQRAFDLAALSWLHVTVHPARFMKDIMLALWSPDPKVMKFARAHSVAEQDIRMAAYHQIARYTANHVNPTNWLYPHSLLLTVPDYMDAPTLDAEGNSLSLVNFEREIRDMAAAHRHIYVYRHENLLDEEKALLTSLKATFLEPPYFEMRNSQYLFLTHPALTSLAGLHSEILDEAPWFDKPVVQLTANGPVRGVLPAKCGEPIPLAADCLSPAFWQGIFSALCGETIAGTYRGEQAEPPNLRLILRGGGSDFDDASSYSQCRWLGSMQADLNEAQLAATWLASGLNTAYAHPVCWPASDRACTYSYAIFAAGDEKVLIPAVVALRSYALHLGNSQLYYIAGEGEISAKGQATLHQYGITLLTSRYHHGFTACYRGSPPAAYLQLAGPDLLEREGYSYSMGIQPDTLCVRSFDTDAIFEQTACIIAPSNGIDRLSMGIKILGTGLPYAAAWEDLDAPGFVPSLLFCNHAGLQEADFLQRAKEYFHNIGSANLPLNEESLLHYFHLTQPGFCQKIAEGYSHIPYKQSQGTIDAIHYDNCLKPWKQTPQRWHARVAILYQVWHRAAVQLLGTKKYKEFVAGLASEKNLKGVQDDEAISNFTAID